jgi:hypothetical protein
MVSEVHCGEAHGKVVTRLDVIEGRAAELKGRVDLHVATNGDAPDGLGHVRRAEFEELKTTVKDIRKWLIMAAGGILLTSGGGSMLAPTVKAIVLKQLGGG